MIPEETIDRVREATDIVALIGADIELKKDGANWKGLCPFHNEKSPSFNVNPSTNHYHCFGCTKSGDPIKWLQDYANMDFKESVGFLARKAGIPVEESGPRKLNRREYAYRDPEPRSASASTSASVKDQTPRRKLRKRSEEHTPQPFDWQSCLDAFDAKAIELMASERGYSTEFIERLHSLGLVGLFRGDFAFPVMDEAGVVVGTHYRTPPKKPGAKKRWAHHPPGFTSPLVIGDPAEATHTLVGESQWDLFAVLDSLAWHEDPRELAAIITRGTTANTDLTGFTVPTLTFIPQNDPREKENADGLTPAEQWLEAVKASRAPGTSMRVAMIPEEFEDANDWIRDDRPDSGEVRRQILEQARNPILVGLRTAGELIGLADEKDDPDCMLGLKRRWLSKGGSGIFVGPSGIGKSTLMSAMTAHWAAGIAWQGIDVRKPLKIVMIQAENDDRDSGEMLQAAFQSLKKQGSLTDEQIRVALKNLQIINETERAGKDWVDWLEEIVRETGAHLIVADPLLSYFGDDISQQKACSIFLRNWLQPVLKRTGVMILFVHHTGKTSSDSKARSHWSASDYAYIGIGSSELTNWPRTIMTLMPANKEASVFKFAIAKRGGRAGMTSGFSKESVSSIHLSHSTNGGLGWTEVPEPIDDEEDAPPPRSRKTSTSRSITRRPTVGKGLSRHERLKSLVAKFPKTQISKPNAVQILIDEGGLSFDEAKKELFTMHKMKMIEVEGELLKPTT